MKNFRKIAKDWAPFILIGSTIFIIAFFLRIYNLIQLPVFVDEAIYIRWAQVMRAEPTLRFLPLSDGKQPLFMWVVIPFLKVFSDPLFAGRIVSVLAGLGSLAGISVLSYLLFKSRRVALISAAIYAVSPFSVFFDRLALVDSMLSFFGVWVLVFTYLSVTQLRLDMAMLAGFALGGSLLTKSPALFFALLLPSTALFVDWGSVKGKAMHAVKLLLLWVVTWVIGYGMQSVLRLGPGFSNLSQRNLDYVHPISHIFTSPFDPLLPHMDRAIEWIVMLGPVLLPIFVIISLLANLRRFPGRIFVVMLWAFVPLIISAAYAKVFTARYIYFTFPAFVTLAGAAFLFFDYPSKIKQLDKYVKHAKRIIPVLLVIYLIHSIIISAQLLLDPTIAPLPRSERSGYLEDWTSGGGIREAAMYIKAVHSENPDAPILVGTEGYFGTLPDGLQIYLQDVPNVTVIGVGIDLHEVPQSLIDSKNASNITYLLANSSRIKFEDSFETMGLEKVLEYKKPLRPIEAVKYHEDGPYETLYLFELQ